MFYTFIRAGSVPKLMAEDQDILFAFLDVHGGYAQIIVTGAIAIGQAAI